MAISITTLNDIVDTLKLHFYPNSNTTLEESTKFNNTIEKLVLLKQEAMLIKNPDNQKRFIKTKLAGENFNVMAVSQSSFNVVLQNGDISISLLTNTAKHSNPIIKVEFRAEFLLRFGYKLAIEKVKDIISELLENYFIKVSEIHLAKDIQGYEFSTFDFHRIKTLSKSKTIFHNDISSEFYFGNRFTGFSVGKGDEMLRVYNKTTEISQKKEKAFVQVLSWELNPDFDNTQNVWRLEFQLRRERLKYLLGDDGLLDSLDNVLNSISNLWAYCISRFQHKDLTTKQVVEQIQGFRYTKDGQLKIFSPRSLRDRFHKAELSPVWNQIKTFENKQSPKLQRIKNINRPEIQYVENSIKATISTLVKLNRGDFSSNNLHEIFMKIDTECKEKHNMTLIDKARLQALDYLAQAQVFNDENGIVQDYLYDYKKDFVDNLQSTYAMLEDEPSNLYTFQEFQKRLHKIK